MGCDKITRSRASQLVFDFEFPVQFIYDQDYYYYEINIVLI